MRNQKLGPRAEYRQQQGERVKQSETLARSFEGLKSLTVELSYSGPETPIPASHLKYTANLLYAKSLFRFDCPNQECVQGDFDLSTQLAKAVASHQTTVSGQEVCRGWQSKTAIYRVPCGRILHYRLTLGYHEVDCVKAP